MAREVNNIAPWAEIVPDAPYPMSQEEFERWPEEPGWHYELVLGRLVRMPAKARHGMFTHRISRMLENFIEEHNLPWIVVDQNTGFKLPVPWLPPEQKVTLAPDVALVAEERTSSIHMLEEGEDEFWPLAPDLAVETASKASNQYRPEMKEKVLGTSEKPGYMQVGTREVWVLYPWQKELDIWHYGEHGPEVHTFKADERIESPLLPGFTPAVKEFMQVRTHQQEQAHAQENRTQEQSHSQDFDH